MIIENTDFNLEPLAEEYYDCVFRGCIFNNLKILSTTFEHCQFIGCNLSLTVFSSALFDTRFESCQMQGCNLSALSTFSNGLVFKDCNLNYANFSQLTMKGMQFKSCSMVEASFADAQIKNSLFDDCNLERTAFDGADLSLCNLETSYHFTINPNHTKLKKARFSRDQLEGLLAHLGIIVS